MKATAEPLQTVSVGPLLSEEQARQIYRQGEEAVVFALLTLAQQAASPAPGSSLPSTPSGMVPPYEKPKATARSKSPGQKPGHPGRRRSIPE